MNRTLMGRITVTRIPPRVNEIARAKQITNKISTDDDDDGLHDLFPAEVKIPPPDSSERPFILDPKWNCAEETLRGNRSSGKKYPKGRRRVEERGP